MAIANNNEIDILTVGGIRNDIRDSFTRAMIASEEETDVATAKRYAGDYIILKSERKLYRITQEIPRGGTYTPGVNLERVTLGDAMKALDNQSASSITTIVGNYEPTGKATKKYEIGERVIIPLASSPGTGIYYITTQVVNPGVTFVENTNCVRETKTISTLIYNLDKAKVDKPVQLEQMLYAGNTTMTFTNSAITNTCLIDIYTDAYGINPISVSQSGTSVTLKFNSRSVNTKVRIVVSKGE